MRKRSHVVLSLFLGSVFVYAAYATWRTENLHGRHQRYAYALGAIRVLGLEADARPGAVSRLPVENTSNASATWRTKDLHGRHMPNQQHVHASDATRTVVWVHDPGQSAVPRVAVENGRHAGTEVSPLAGPVEIKPGRIGKKHKICRWYLANEQLFRGSFDKWRLRIVMHAELAKVSHQRHIAR
jgi:hypothetical protein